MTKIKKVFYKCPYCNKEQYVDDYYKHYLRAVKEKSINCFRCKLNFNLKENDLKNKV